MGRRLPSSCSRAIDVRGVTPTAVDDVTLDPNGSAQATQCSPCSDCQVALSP